MLFGSGFVVTHNAGFDGLFVEKLLAPASGMPWAGTQQDGDWTDPVWRADRCPRSSCPRGASTLRTKR